MNLEESVRRVIVREGLMAAGDRVLVAVSGGIDSTTLLFILNELKRSLEIELAVAHVNHQLRGDESERDESFVRTLAQRYAIPFHACRTDVAGYSRSQGISLQHAGREVRYRFFHDIAVAHGYCRIALGHNRDDQVETLLLRLVKGTGIHGLSSIPLRRGPVIRPLLLTYRSEIEAYGRSHSILYVDDSSNHKDRYERNYLRHHVVPLLEQLNPQFRKKILSLLADITSVNALFDSKADEFLKDHVLSDGGESRTCAADLSVLDNETRFRVVSRLLCRLEPRFIPLREHVRLVDKSLFSRRPNNRVCLPHGIEVKRAYDTVIFTKKAPVPRVTEVFDVVQGKNHLPELGVTIHVSVSDAKPETVDVDRMTAFLDGDRIGALRIRTFREGDRFVPLGMKESTKLKNYFISRKVPKDERRNVPLLMSGDDVVWVVGDRIDDRYKVTGRTQRFLKLAARWNSWGCRYPEAPDGVTQEYFFQNIKLPRH